MQERHTMIHARFIYTLINFIGANPSYYFPSRLYDASKNGDLAEVQRLLAAGTRTEYNDGVSCRCSDVCCMLYCMLCAIHCSECVMLYCMMYCMLYIFA